MPPEMKRIGSANAPRNEARNYLKCSQKWNTLLVQMPPEMELTVSAMLPEMKRSVCEMPPGI